MHIMSTNFAKTLVWKHNYDVKLWRHKQRTPSTNDYPMPLNETPHEIVLRTPLYVITIFDLLQKIIEWCDIDFIFRLRRLYYKLFALKTQTSNIVRLFFLVFYSII